MLVGACKEAGVTTLYAEYMGAPTTYDGLQLVNPFISRLSSRWRTPMAKDRATLGAKIVGELPDVGGGAFGMARMAHLLHERLTPSQGERPGRPTNAAWVRRPKVPMSEKTAKKLADLAAAMSTSERKVSPMQLAAQLLEEALGRVDRDR